MDDAQSIFDRLVNKYAQCKSYKDQGSVDFDIYLEYLSFTTSFVRRGCYKFECQVTDPKDHKQTISGIWFDGSSAYQYLRGEPLKRVRSLASAITREAFARPSARYIPALLMSTIAYGSNALPWKHYDFSSNDYDEGRYHLVTEKDDGEIRIEIWIDRDGFFVEKILEKKKGPTREEFDRMRFYLQDDRSLNVDRDRLGNVSYSDLAGGLELITRYENVIFDAESTALPP